MADTDPAPDTKSAPGIRIRRTPAPAPSTPGKSQPQGSWVAYKQSADGSFSIVRIFSAEIRALRYAIANEAHVLFLNFDTDLSDAVKAAAAR